MKFTNALSDIILEIKKEEKVNVYENPEKTEEIEKEMGDPLLTPEIKDILVQSFTELQDSIEQERDRKLKKLNRIEDKVIVKLYNEIRSRSFNLILRKIIAKVFREGCVKILEESFPNLKLRENKTLLQKMMDDYKISSFEEYFVRKVITHIMESIKNRNKK